MVCLGKCPIGFGHFDVEGKEGCRYAGPCGKPSTYLFKREIHFSPNGPHGLYGGSGGFVIDGSFDGASWNAYREIGFVVGVCDRIDVGAASLDMLDKCAPSHVPEGKGGPEVATDISSGRAGEGRQ